ncbi:MAG TPA: hypothetical protein VJZ27_19165, partial [Aggregatilineales bacterium]|nr:hypothetical protein [Aggregatilineales bacterium]
MDVLLISGAPPYPLNDPARALVHYLARDLGQYHYVIDLVSFFSEPEDFAQIPRYERYFRKVEFIPRPELSPAMLQQRIEHPEIRFPAYADVTWSPQMWSSISELVTNRHYDVVQVVGGIEVYEYFHLIHTLPNLFVTALSSLQLRHELEGVTSNRRKQRQLQQELDLMRDYESWMYSPYQQVVISTQEELHLLQKMAQTQVTTMPPGVDMDYFVPTGHEPQIPALMFIGDFASHSVHSAARRLCEVILPVVKRSIPEAVLFLVGANPP